MKIDGAYNQKSLNMSDSLLNFNLNKEKKGDYEEKEFSSIKPINQKKIIIRNQFEDNKIDILNKDENKKINIKHYINNSTNINNNIFNNINLFSKTTKHSLIRNNSNILTNELSLSKKRTINLEVNEEQQKIMKKIRDYYNNKKKLMDKKSHQNIVECNVINLNSNEIKYKYSSAKNSKYSKTKINLKRNDLKEISTKIKSQLRRTDYKFFNKNDKLNSIKHFKSFDNGISA
jgi:hypothetical protein